MQPLKAQGPWRLVLALMGVPLGAALQLQQAAVAGYGAVAMLLTVAILLGLASLRLRLPSFGGSVLFGIAVAAATFALADGRAQMRLNDRLDPALEGRDIELVGVVVGLPRLSPEGTQFEFLVESARHAGQSVAFPERLRLNWTVGWDGEHLLASPPVAIVAGDRWQLTTRARRPHGAFNPYGFDAELWMLERGLGGSGAVRPGARWLGSTWRFPIDRWRQHARDAVLRQVPDAQAAGVLAALAVGDQASIDLEAHK